MTAKKGKTHPLKQAALYWAPIVIYCLLIFIQSSHPAPRQAFVLPFMDKLLHAGGYALLGFLIFRGLRGTGVAGDVRLLLFLSSVLATLYGISDEVHQHFVPFRDADVLDAAADMLGSIFGAGGAALFYRRRHKA